MTSEFKDEEERRRYIDEELTPYERFLPGNDLRFNYSNPTRHNFTGTVGAQQGEEIFERPVLNHYAEFHKKYRRIHATSGMPEVEIYSGGVFKKIRRVSNDPMDMTREGHPHLGNLMMTLAPEIERRDIPAIDVNGNSTAFRLLPAESITLFNNGEGVVYDSTAPRKINYQRSSPGVFGIDQPLYGDLLVGSDSEDDNES